jgi:Predicted transcriptional regulator
MSIEEIARIYKNLHQENLIARNVRWEVVMNIFFAHPKEISKYDLCKATGLTYQALKYHLEKLEELKFIQIRDETKSVTRNKKVISMTQPGIEKLSWALKIKDADDRITQDLSPCGL